MVLILMGTALLNRIIQIFERDATSYRILFGSSVALLVIAIFVNIIGLLVVAVSRFHKNMFSNEGYLTLSLPVTTEQHLTAKILGYFISSLVIALGILLSISIATFGDVLVELLKAGGYLTRQMAKVFKGNLPFYCIEVLVMIILAEIKTLLVFYTCMCIGQRAKKNRIGLSVACFFIYYFFCQVLGTVLTIVFSVLAANGVLDKLLEFIADNMKMCLHLGFGFGILYSLIFAGIYFAVCNYILKKRLNLE